jgi:hypothetical protein
MKSTDSNQNTQSSHRQKTPSAGISNRPPANEEQQQRQLPPRGQAKKGSHARHRLGSGSAKG